MKNRTIYLLFAAIMIFGFFFGVYVRQPLGFIVAFTALIGAIYFFIKN